VPASITLNLYSGFWAWIGVGLEINQIKPASYGTETALFTGIFIDLNHIHFKIPPFIDNRFSFYIQEYGWHKHLPLLKNYNFHFILRFKPAPDV
jgi:hypothetical protein